MAVTAEEAQKSKSLNIKVACSNDKNSSEYLKLEHVSASSFTVSYNSIRGTKKNNFPNNFYFIRHSQTDAHNKKLICGGDWDIPINEAGESQAKGAAEDFHMALRSIKTIVTSPLLRARQTAEILSF